MFLHVQACSCMCSLYLCVCRLVLAHVCLFFNSCACRFQLAHVYRILRTQPHSCACMVSGKNPSLGIWTPFSSMLHLFAILTSFLTIFCIQLYDPCHISSYYESNITFLLFSSPNDESNLTLFLQVLPLYSGKGSTSRALVWYSILTEDTQGHIHAASFEPIIHLLLERSTSAILV